MRFKIDISVKSRKISYGQHRHGKAKEQTVIEVADADMRKVRLHLLVCPENPEVKDNTQIPLHFVMDKEKTDIGTIFCGFCQNRIWTCKVKEIKNDP